MKQETLKNYKTRKLEALERIADALEKLNAEGIVVYECYRRRR